MTAIGRPVPPGRPPPVTRHPGRASNRVMRPTRVLALLCLFAMIAALVASADAMPPRRKGPLLRWLRAGTYRATYAAEPAVHASATAHGMHVRTYYDPTLVADLAAGRTTFRRGAAMVKELYFGGQEDVIGWSVMRKLRGGRGGATWLFYETLDGTNARPFFGRGLAVCTGCHAAGIDFLLSPFRPLTALR